MKKTLLTLILLAFSSAALAEICTTLAPSTFPRQDLKLKESYIRILEHPTLGGPAIAIGYLTATRGQICCGVSHFDDGSISSLLESKYSAVARPASQLAVEMWSSLPWSNRAPSTPWAVQVCQELANTMTADGILEAFRVVRNTNRTDGSRPMFVLNAAGAMVNLKVNNMQVYVEAGRICEAEPVVSRTTAGLWLHVTNTAGVRGISLCKLSP